MKRNERKIRQDSRRGRGIGKKNTMNASKPGLACISDVLSETWAVAEHFIPMYDTDPARTP
jgi:hypothetical protein